MSGGIIALVARSYEDIFLTGDPQITFFKSMYRRYSNFSTEPIFQNFDQDNIKLGDKITCTLSKEGDLVGQTYLMIEFPPIPEYITENCQDPIKKFAWARKLGFAIINYVDIEIGGHEIDRQYGEWMNIWSELAYTQIRGLDIMIGNVPELYNFTNGKDQYLLYIPLFFWFCRHPSSSLPLISMHYNDVKIHVQLNDPSDCFLLGPTNSINIIDDVVHFEPFEVIYQVISGSFIYGIFIAFDPVNRILYYNKINGTEQLYFMGLNTAALLQQSASMEFIDAERQTYVITGSQSSYTVLPQDNKIEQDLQISLPEPLQEDIVFLNCQLDTVYIYLDSDERARFSSIPHEYIIEQMQFVPAKQFSNTSMSQKLGLNHPVQELYWVVQYQFMTNAKDNFNYTNKPYRDKDGNFAGDTLVAESTIYLNAQKRMETKPFSYYNYIQPYQHHSHESQVGVNIYSFALFPERNQVSGSCNMSRINDILLKTKLNNVDLNFNIVQRIYAKNINVLRILNGLAGILFNN